MVSKQTRKSLCNYRALRRRVPEQQPRLLHPPPQCETRPPPLSQLIKPRPAKSPSEPTPTYASFDIHFDITNVGTLATRNGGRDALHILNRLRDSDDSVLVSKGINCLQAYYDRYDPLSIEKPGK
jgi:hypothetical protein